MTGMSCINCERKIEQRLNRASGIEEAKVSYNKGLATIDYDEEIISQTEIEQMIRKAGYELKQDKKMSVLDIILIVVIIVLLFNLLNHRFGLMNMLNAFPLAKVGMSYWMLFIIGALTSFHCIAMCGGIVLSQSLNKDNERSSVQSSFLYNTGRVLSYTLIGGIVGALGSVISLSSTFQGIMQLIGGVLMLIMGINLLNIFPWLRKLNPRMPEIFTRHISKAKKGRGSFYVGMLNGLMPCGPLQAMQLFALATGNPFEGALSMFLFSLGTTPMMFGIGAISKKFADKIMAVGAVLVIF